MSFVSSRSSLFPEAKSKGTLRSKRKTGKKSFTLRQIYRSFKEHDLITCESKVHVVAALGGVSEF